MNRVKHTMRLIEQSIGHIDPRYDLCAANIEDIHRQSNNDFDLICNSFRFGYMQGRKAAKAEMESMAIR